jgi:acyl-CoA reductase-like NAD-dependent aldehyde dehydrogenase
MHFLNSLSATEWSVMERFLKAVVFPKGACILTQGDPGDGCYLIDAGEVRLELEHVEADSENVLGHLGAGSLLGELALCDRGPRSASAFAETEVQARWLGCDDFDRLCREQPQLGLAISQAMAGDLTAKLRNMNRRLVEFIFQDEIDEATHAMVARAAAAQKDFAAWPEDRVDALLQDLAQAIADQAEPLAAATVQETAMGVVADKVAKNRFAALAVVKSLVGRPGNGLLPNSAGTGVTGIAAPVGVVLGLLPVTNPVATMVFKTLVCLKGRNAVIFSCHRNAQGVSNQAGTLMREVLRRHGAAEDLVQWIQGRISRRTTAKYMKHPGVGLILATGGPSMVHAAYSSGRPALGVGSGNAPCWIAADADVEAAAGAIVLSKSFDAGVICGSENNLVVDASRRETFVAALVSHGAALLTADEKARLAAIIFDPESGHLEKAVIGRPAAETAVRAGIERPYEIRLLVAPVTTAELATPFALEKLAPILSLFTVPDEAEALALCESILNRCGKGHTAIVHTQSEEVAQRFGAAITASRLLVNAPGTHGCIGLGTGLVPSLTLGCGTFGGNSTTDNVTYTHLINLKRLARALPVSSV